MDLPIWVQVVAMMLGGGGGAAIIKALGDNSGSFRKDLMDRVKLLEERISQVEASNDGFIKANALLEAKLATTEGKLAAAEARIADLTNRLTTVMLENEMLKRTNKDLLERIEGLERHDTHGGTHA